MAEIFVSYARKDKEQVLQILRDLSSLGYEYWMDSHKIQGGELWTQEIPEAIEACRAVLFFMSADSIRSDNVRREIQLAFEKKRKIVILRLDRSEIPLPLQYPLAGIQWIDYSDSDWKSRLSIALRTARLAPKPKVWVQETVTTSSTDETEQVRRFEGAMPGTTNLNTDTEVRVMISLPASKGLRAHLSQTGRIPGEMTKHDVSRSDVPLDFPRDPATHEPLDVDLWLVITALGFDIQQPAKKIRVPAKSDSGVFSFSLTPRVASQRAIVTLELRERKNGPALGTLTLTTEVKPLQGEMTQALWILASLLITSAIVIPEQAAPSNFPKAYRPTDLPSGLRQAIESTIPYVREGAVRELGQLLRGSDKSLVRLARGILKTMTKEDDSQRVQEAAFTILKDYEQTKTVRDISRPSMPSPLERTQPTKPISVQPTARKGTSNRNPSQRTKLPEEILAALVQGILGLIGVALTAYVTYTVAFAPREANQTPEVSTMTSVVTSIASFTAIVTTPFPSAPIPEPTSVVTYTPYLIQTPTPGTTVPPTNTPTSTFVPTIIVPSNTPTHAFTPIPVLPTFTRTGGGAGKIAFASDQNGNYEIYVMNADGSGLINLTNNGAVDSQPSWSPDGRRIAFSSTRDDANPSTCVDRCHWEIYVMNVDGSNLSRVTNNGLSNGGTSWSPDGRKIAFVAGVVNLNNI